jgi:hypothetical protein
MENDEDGYVEITIGTKLSDLDVAKEDASDLAWEHATELARSINLDLGSEKFEEIFRELALRYEGNIDYLKFFLMTAMLTIRELLETKTLALPYSGERISETEVLALISSAARALVGNYMWLAAGQNLAWPKNEEMPDEVHVSFYFDPEDIEEEEV